MRSFKAYSVEGAEALISSPEHFHLWLSEGIRQWGKAGRSGQGGLAAPVSRGGGPRQCSGGANALYPDPALPSSGALSWAVLDCILLHFPWLHPDCLRQGSILLGWPVVPPVSPSSGKFRKPSLPAPQHLSSQVSTRAHPLPWPGARPLECRHLRRHPCFLPIAPPGTGGSSALSGPFFAGTGGDAGENHSAASLLCWSMGIAGRMNEAHIHHLSFPLYFYPFLKNPSSRN